MLAPDIIVSLVFGSFMLIIGIIAIWQGTHCYRRRGEAADEEAGGRPILGVGRIRDENPISLDNLDATTPQDEEANEFVPSKLDKPNTKPLSKEVNQSTLSHKSRAPNNGTYGQEDLTPSVAQDATLFEVMHNVITALQDKESNACKHNSTSGSE